MVPCDGCDTRVIVSAMFRCGYHETGPLCPHCWWDHRSRYAVQEQINYCWDDPQLRWDEATLP